MMTDIQNATILIMATDGFEQSELMEPLQALRNAGATVRVAAPGKTREQGRIRGWKDGEWGEAVDVDMNLSQVNVGDYNALVLPGGVMNPDKLRTEPKAVQLVRQFTEEGKVVAAVCHGPWMLVEAGVAEGRTMTSYTSIQTDVKNAGANWVDEEVVADDGIITSRYPGDLKAFCDKIIEEITEGNHGPRPVGASHGMEARQ